MLWTTGWHVTRVKCFAPRRQRHNYDITWADGTRGSNLDLDEYYCLNRPRSLETTNNGPATSSLQTT
eukprot:1172107-Prorocentrum_minimum.AAC.1